MPLSGVITKNYEYNHAGRLLSVSQDIEDDPNGEIILAKYEYNELGQVINKKLHNKSDNSYLQKVDYTYNIRGWLETINNPANIQSDGDLFAMQLSYNDEITELGNTARYNGDISAMVWAVNYDNVFYYNTKQKAYAYNYDGADRLKSANYFEEQTGSLTDVDPFDLVDVSYDKNGNITSLTRNGNSEWAIDDFEYNYQGNILESVNELADDLPSGGTLSMLSTGSSQRQYDANGNLTESTGRHDVNILYNYLNLPREIVTCTDTIHYIYDATGNKWAEYYSGTQTFEKYYMGNFQYTNQNLDYIHNAYGRIRLKNDEYHYDYYLSDHLGNVRAVFTDNGAVNAELLQANSYYPFGMQFKQAPEYQVESNNYLYNGKELQQYGNLNTYDYGWRQYDAALGRWHVQDQLAEKYHSFSPYNYVANNPMNLIDPDGRDPLNLSAIIESLMSMGDGATWYNDGSNGGGGSYSMGNGLNLGIAYNDFHGSWGNTFAGSASNARAMFVIAKSVISYAQSVAKIGFTGTVNTTFSNGLHIGLNFGNNDYAVTIQGNINYFAQSEWDPTNNVDDFFPGRRNSNNEFDQGYEAAWDKHYSEQWIRAAYAGFNGKERYRIEGSPYPVTLRRTFWSFINMDKWQAGWNSGFTDSYYYGYVRGYNYELEERMKRGYKINEDVKRNIIEPLVPKWYEFLGW